MTKIISIPYLHLKELFRKFNVLTLNMNEYSYVNFLLNIEIEPFTRFDNNLFSMGAFSYACSIFPYDTKVGRYCSIAQNVEVIGADHPTDWITTSGFMYSYVDYNAYGAHKSLYDTLPKDTDHIYHAETGNVVIGNDVWIGQHVKIKPNVKIGTGAIIGACSLVTKDVEPFTIVGGVPAKPIRKRFSEEIIDRITTIQWWKYNIKDIFPFPVENPEKFLDVLEHKIQLQQIRPYTPEVITSANILQEVKTITRRVRENNSTS